jgi:hypothetical protein
VFGVVIAAVAASAFKFKYFPLCAGGTFSSLLFTSSSDLPGGALYCGAIKGPYLPLTEVKGDIFGFAVTEALLG